MDELLRTGQVRNFAELAEFGQVNRDSDKPDHEPDPAGAGDSGTAVFLPRVESGEIPCF